MPQQNHHATLARRYVSRHFPCQSRVDMSHSPLLLQPSAHAVSPILAMFHDLNVPWPGAGADAVRELQRTVAFLDECTQTRRPGGHARCWLTCAVGYDVLALTHTYSGKLPSELVRGMHRAFHPPRARLQPKTALALRLSCAFLGAAWSCVEPGRPRHAANNRPARRRQYQPRCRFPSPNVCAYCDDATSS